MRKQSNGEMTGRSFECRLSKQEIDLSGEEMENLDHVVRCTEDAHRRTEAGWEQRWREALERRGIDPERARVKIWIHMDTQVNGLSRAELRKIYAAEMDMFERYPAADNIAFHCVTEYESDGTVKP